MSAELRVGIVGLGSMGRHHARVVRSTPGLRLVAVADSHGDAYDVAAGLPVLPNVESLIAEGLDAAIVAVPTAHHEAVATSLAQAGVATMVEKPIADSVAAGERLHDAFSKAGVVGCVGYVERCNPAALALRERLQDGFLGEIYQITTSRQGPFPPRITDVGVVQDLATHDFDFTPWISGADYSQLSAHVQSRSGRGNEDMVVVTGRLSNGVIVNHMVNWLSPRKERQCIVTGERGALVADTLTGDLTFYANGVIENEWDAVATFRGVSEGDVTRFAIQKREPLMVEAAHFRDAVLGDETDGIVPMSEGVRVLKVVEACLQSAAEGREIHLAEPVS